MQCIEQSIHILGCTGSLRYMAPECALYEPYNEMVDIYSVGVIMWQMITGLNPYAGLNRDEFMLRVVHNNERPPTVFSSGAFPIVIPPELKQVIEQCWVSDWTLRPSALDLLMQLALIQSTLPARKCCFF